MAATFFGQFKALVKKNLLLKRRNKGPLIQEILYPIYFSVIIAVIKKTTQVDTLPVVTSDELPSSYLYNVSSVDYSKTLLVSPNTPEVQTIANDTANILVSMTSISTKPNIQYYSDMASMLAQYQQNSNYSIGINFNYNGGNLHTYAIRTPWSNTADTTSFTRDQSQCRSTSSNCEVDKYFKDGFSVYQAAIDTALIRNELNVANFPAPDIQVRRMPKPSFTPDTSYLQTISSIYYVIAYSPFVNFLTVHLVAEKEKKIKEGMQMMGLRDAAFWLSWGLLYFVIMTLATAGITIITVAMSFFTSSSNVFIFFLILMLYGLSIITMSCIMSTFFQKAQSAGGLSSMASIIISCLYLAISLTRTQLPSGVVEYAISPGVRWLLCLISPVAVALAIDQAIYLDKPLNGGMTFSSINDGDFPLYAPMLMLFIDFVLYFFIAIYLDNVLPGEYGAKQKPWYFLMKNYWCARDISSEELLLSNVDVENVDCEDIEPVTADLSQKVAIRISNVTKEFKSKDEKGPVKAVNGLSLDMYEGQITALLGHNGAGKTTLVNMLTGLMPPTSGTAHILGLDIRSGAEMVQIRGMTGVCPQHNILFDDLTCIEHLRLYAGLKGVKDSEVENQAEELMKMVGLENEKESFSKKLSGGQKRKLSVCIALIGDPKVIFLDEPTAGMDPFSRRQLWSILKERKRGRVILLTTHFMDEADILADRKAIISKGQLRCCGSSLFLKSRFGIGYHLNMVVEQACDQDTVTDLVKSCVEGAEFERFHGKELAYTLPLSEVRHFSVLFSTLDKPNTSLTTKAESLGIKSYGVAMTTLEEVFLKLEEDDSTVELKEMVSANKKESILLSSYGAIQVSDKQSVNDIVTDIDYSDAKMALPVLEDDAAIRSQQFWALCKVRAFRFYRLGMLVFFSLILPVIFVMTGILISKYGTQYTDSSGPQALFISTAIDKYKSSGILVRDSVASVGSQQFISSNIGGKYTTKVFTNVSTLLDLDGTFNLGLDLTQYTSTNPTIDTGFTALFNDSAIHSVAAIISVIDNAILEAAAALTSKNFTAISTVSLPWPRLKVSPSYNQGAMSAVILIAMAFVTIPPGFTVEVVKDRQFKVRGQLRVSGLSFTMYWGTAFFVDMVKFSIPVVLSVIMVLAFQPESLSPAGAVLAFILICLAYIPSTTALSYVMSFMFDKFESSITGTMVIYFFAGFVPFLAISISDMITSGQTDTDIPGIVHYIFCIIDPPYVIFGGLYYVERIYRVSIYTGEKSIPVKDYFEGRILIAILVPIIHLTMFTIFLRMLDIKKTGGDISEAFPCLNNKMDQKVKPIENSDIPEDEDEDVSNERRRVKDFSMHTRLTEVAICQNLRKEFQKDSGNCCKRGKKKEKVKVAVKNATFAVDVGEIFGLLGPNGAGKTTTMNMMIAETGCTKGRVVMGGYDIHSCMSDAFKAMGYCPQHDALWDVVTLKEHIECYAAIRGIPKKEIPKIMDQFLKKMQIEEHKNKKTRDLSGGTKRKLSYIMSMLGRPKIVMLDEPSTGMDPKSKRYLWDTISSSITDSERGSILTTHYMEEADALCARIAIMVNGQLKCLGPTQHLKGKYGSGYLLEVKLCINSESTDVDIEDDMDKLEHHLESLFTNISCLERFGERAQYKIPRDSVSSLAETFSSLEQTKESHNLEEYSFSQSTLEQVFLEFAKKQLEENAEQDDEVETGRTTSFRITPSSQNSNATHTVHL